MNNSFVHQLKQTIDTKQNTTNCNIFCYIDGKYVLSVLCALGYVGILSQYSSDHGETLINLYPTESIWP